MKHNIDTSQLSEPVQLNQRLIGKYLGNESGPTFIFIGGIHGNEPSGVLALQEVMKTLKKEQIYLKGDVYALAGNLQALAQHQRYIDKDLNRIWYPDRLQKLEHHEDELDLDDVREMQEQKELLKEIENIVDEATGEIYFIDLHTTSSESMPFITIGDTLRNRKFALNFPIPIILGIEEELDGTILNYINETGFIALGFEAGQHTAPSSLENHIAFIWLTLEAANCIEADDITAFESYYETFSKSNMEVRGIYELRHRHKIAEDEDFKMEKGYVNFQPVKKGEVLARNQEGKIRSPASGRIFMPLYQSQGENGFYLVRGIAKFWLKVSEYLRKWEADRILSFLPGVKLHPLDNSTLMIDTRIARWFVLEILHLMGYRRESWQGSWLIATKRRFDIHSPTKKASSIINQQENVQEIQK